MGGEREKFRDKLLLKLATAYEEGKSGGVGLQNPTPIETEVVAELKADESVKEQALTLWLTDKGYNKHKRRIAALRALSESN